MKNKGKVSNKNKACGKKVRCGKSTVSVPVAFSTEVIAACTRYDAAAAKSDCANWARAAVAKLVREACDTAGHHYLPPVMALTKVSPATVSTDIAVMELCTTLGFEPETMPRNSYSAMYELHLGGDAALELAGRDADKREKASEKIKLVGTRIMDGSISVRDVRREFAQERLQARLMAQGNHRKPAATVPPKVETIDMSDVKRRMEEGLIPGSKSVKVFTVVPQEVSAAAITSIFAKRKIADYIASECMDAPRIWICIDMIPARKLRVKGTDDGVAEAPGMTIAIGGNPKAENVCAEKMAEKCGDVKDSGDNTSGAGNQANDAGDAAGTPAMIDTAPHTPAAVRPNSVDTNTATVKACKRKPNTSKNVA